MDAISLEECAKLTLEAAEMGCKDAAEEAAMIYADGLGVEENARKAAQWLLRGGFRSQLRSYLSSNPLACAPLGTWEPRWHPLVPLEIHRAMRATMLLCERAGLPAGVARIVTEYVCTDGEEWEGCSPN